MWGRLGLGLLLLGLWSACGLAADDARALYKEGLRAFRAGKPDEAIALFRRSEAADTSYIYPTFALGRIHQEFFEQETRGYEDAVASYERIVSLISAKPLADSEKSLYQAYYFRGLLYLKGGEYPKALDSLHRFLELSPDFANPEYVHNGIGIAYYYLNQYDEAVKAFRKAIELRPDYAEARFNLRSVFTRLAVYGEAVANARAGNLDAAMEKVLRLKEYAPRYIPGRKLEADLLERGGRLAEAETAYGEAIRLEPLHPLSFGLRLELARLLAERGDRPRAAELLRENLSLFPATKDSERAEVLQFLARLGEKP